MLHIYCGDGKGKTTAAIGLLVRASGAGKKVVFSQFMKGQESSEIAALRFLPDVRIVRENKEFPFFAQMSEEQKREITKIHNRILEECTLLAESGQCDVLVLDEVAYAYEYSLLDKEALLRLLQKKEQMEIIVTGRNPSSLFTENADYITEMKKIRHPYDKGVAARVGIEM